MPSCVMSIVFESARSMVVAFEVSAVCSRSRSVKSSDLSAVSVMTADASVDESVDSEPLCTAEDEVCAVDLADEDSEQDARAVVIASISESMMAHFFFNIVITSVVFQVVVVFVMYTLYSPNLKCTLGECENSKKSF